MGDVVRRVGNVFCFAVLDPFENPTGFRRAVAPGGVW